MFMFMFAYLCVALFNCSAVPTVDLDLK